MKQTTFKTVTSGVILRKQASSSSHALVALLLAPKLLKPEKLQVTIVGILPNKRSQLYRYCLVWGIRSVYGPATVGQVTIKVFYRLRPDPSCIFFFSFFKFKYDVEMPN